MTGTNESQLPAAIRPAGPSAAFPHRRPSSSRLQLHAPRLWPEYHASYFAAFVRDPDGNNIEAVSHLAE